MEKKLLNFKSPWVVVSLVALVYLVFIGVRLFTCSYGISCFINAGNNLTYRDQIPKNLVIVPNDGYDGQYYYRLALNPFTTQKVDHGIVLDYPAYRQQRILYPLLSWIFSLGQIILIPYIMVLVNLGGLVFLSWISIHYVRLVGLNSWWGIVPVLYPGLIISLGWNLTEIWSVGLLLAAIYYLHRERIYLASLFLSLAILARETVLVAVAVLFLWWFISFFRKKTTKLFWLVWLLPSLIFIIWQVFLYILWDKFSWQGLPNFNWPLVGLFSLRHLWSSFSALWFFEIIYLLFLAVNVILVYKSSIIYDLEKFIWLGYLGMMLVITSPWYWDTSILRAATEFAIFSIIIILGGTSKLIRWYCLLFTIFLWSLLFMIIISQPS